MLAALFGSALFTAMAFLLAFPKTPAVKALRRDLIEAPARFLRGMTWRRARTYVLAIPVIVILLVLGPELMTLIVLAGGDAAAIELLLLVGPCPFPEPQRPSAAGRHALAPAPCGSSASRAGPRPNGRSPIPSQSQPKRPERRWTCAGMGVRLTPAAPCAAGPRS